MTRTTTFHTATIAEFSDPDAVLERAGGRPIAVLRNSEVFAYFVPAEWVENGGQPYETMEAVIEALRQVQGA